MTQRTHRSAKVWKFTVVLTKDEDDPGVLNVSVPALPGCFTFGKGKREALKHAKDAIRCYIDSLVEAKEPIPEEVESIEVTV